MIKHLYLLSILSISIACSSSSKDAEKLYNAALSTSLNAANTTNEDSLRYSLELLERAIAIDSTNEKSYSLKSNIHLILEDNEGAFKTAKEGWDRTKENYTLAVFTGANFESRKDDINAKRYYTAALDRINQLDTTDVKIYLERASIMMLLDRPIEMSRVKSMISKSPDSLSLSNSFNKIVEADKKDSLAYLITGY